MFNALKYTGIVAPSMLAVMPIAYAFVTAAAPDKVRRIEVAAAHLGYLERSNIFRDATRPVDRFWPVAPVRAVHLHNSLR